MLSPSERNPSDVAEQSLSFDAVPGAIVGLQVNLMHLKGVVTSEITLMSDQRVLLPAPPDFATESRGQPGISSVHVLQGQLETHRRGSQTGDPLYFVHMP